MKRYDFDKVRSNYTIDKIAKLPLQITESSGLALAADQKSVWTHNDGGSPAELFRVTLEGDLEEIRRFSNLKNYDWEELAQDRAGRLFIGDFGNNQNNRRDLAIYIIKEDASEKELETITFRYGLQTEYPESRKKRHFDCEAFFYHQDTLYLFSKNTGSKPRYTYLYKIPARAGDYTLYPSDSIRLNETITAADIAPDGKQFALLSYGKIFLFDIYHDNISFSLPAGCLRFYKGQTEAILYSKEGNLLITNEKGKMFRVSSK